MFKKKLNVFTLQATTHELGAKILMKIFFFFLSISHLQKINK